MVLVNFCIKIGFCVRYKFDVEFLLDIEFWCVINVVCGCVIECLEMVWLLSVFLENLRFSVGGGISNFMFFFVIFLEVVIILVYCLWENWKVFLSVDSLLWFFWFMGIWYFLWVWIMSCIKGIFLVLMV